MSVGTVKTPAGVTPENVCIQLFVNGLPAIDLTIPKAGLLLQAVTMTVAPSSQDCKGFVCNAYWAERGKGLTGAHNEFMAETDMADNPVVVNAQAGRD